MNEVKIPENIVDLAIKIIEEGEYCNYLPIEIDYVLRALRDSLQ